MKLIRGKRALVTGAASGIGRAIAIALAREGVDLVLWDLNEPDLASLAQAAQELGVHAEAARIDLAKPEEITAGIQSLLSRYGSLDILINNAGVAFYGPTHTMTATQWDWLMGINLRAPIQITQELLPTLLELPEAHIVNVCSISGLIAGGRFSAYHTSKYGLIGFSEALRAEYGRRGLGVTALCPGPVQTNLYRKCLTGKQGKSVPRPPRWLCTTTEAVARQTIKAIRYNRRLPIIGLMAHLLYNIKWLAPGLIDFLHHFRRKRRVVVLSTSPVEAGPSDTRRVA